MIALIDNYDSFTFNLYQYLGDLGAGPKVFRNDAIGLEELMALKPKAIVLSPGPGHPSNRRDFGVCTDILATAGAENGAGKRKQETDDTEPETGNTKLETGDWRPCLPILGVCLGHQGIITAFGGKVGKAPKPMHGKTSMVEHDGKGLFEGIDSPVRVMRYHSLVGTGIPDCLEVCARSADDGQVMAVRHKELPIHGIQFHPESLMTEHGKKMLGNFLRC